MDERVNFLALDTEDAAVCNDKNASLLTKDWTRWRCAWEGVEATGSDHIHFLQIDPVQLSLALRRSLPNACTVSGILFKPSIHYHALWGNNRSWREYGRDVRKKILYEGMLMNSRLSSLLTLDPYFPAYANEHLINGSKVEWACDPMRRPEPSTETVPSAMIPEDRTIFLIFGSLAERKGIFQVLDALSHLSKTVRTSLSIVFAGRLREDVRDAFQSAFQDVQQRYPEVTLHLEDRFLPESELAVWISKADIVLAPYQRAMGSSGVLLWASALEKPVLTQDYGFIGAYVREHDLGLTVETTSPASIARGIQTFIRNSDRVPVDHSSMRDLIARHHPDRFAETILDAVM